MPRQRHATPLIIAIIICLPLFADADASHADALR